MKKLLLKLIAFLIYTFKFDHVQIERQLKKKILFQKKSPKFAFPVVYANGMIMKSYTSYSQPVGILFNGLILPIFMSTQEMTYLEALLYCKRLKDGKLEWRLPSSEEMRKIAASAQKINEIRDVFGVRRINNIRWVWLAGGNVSDSFKIFDVPSGLPSTRQKVYPVADLKEN